MGIKDQPIVSIVIPMRNEERFVGKCLASVIEQEFPRNSLQIVVVDGNSADNSRQIVKDYMRQFGFISLFDNPQKITPISMNIGIKHSKGDIIIILSAHSFVPKDFVAKNVKYLESSGADCVGGTIELLNSSATYFGKIISFVLVSPFGVSNSLFRYSKKEQFVDTVFNGAYKKEVFSKVGLFDEQLARNQDIELNSRIRRAGGMIYFTPEIKSFPYTRPSLKKMIEQNYSNGLWNIKTLLRNPRALSIRHFVPLIFVLFLFIAALFSFFNVLFWYGFITILSAYFVMAILFSIPIALKQGFGYLLGLPFVFFLFHFCYGFGTLNGIIKAFFHKV